MTLTLLVFIGLVRGTADYLVRHFRVVPSLFRDLAVAVLQIEVGLVAVRVDPACAGLVAPLAVRVLVRAQVSHHEDLRLAGRRTAATSRDKPTWVNIGNRCAVIYM
jgi:hypothetical protein